MEGRQRAPTSVVACMSVRVRTTVVEGREKRSISALQVAFYLMSEARKPQKTFAEAVLWDQALPAMGGCW